jgi:hypothetical protein
MLAFIERVRTLRRSYEDNWRLGQVRVEDPFGFAFTAAPDVSVNECGGGPLLFHSGEAGDPGSWSLLFHACPHDPDADPWPFDNEFVLAGNEKEAVIDLTAIYLSDFRTAPRRDIT